MNTDLKDTPATAIVTAFDSGDSATAIALFQAAGGGLYAFINGYDDLERVLSSMPHGFWRHHESLLGAYIVFLAKNGRAGRAQAHLNDSNLTFKRTYMSDFFELLLAIHLGDPVSSGQLNSWLSIEQLLPLASPLLEGLFYNCSLVFLVRHGRIKEARIAGQRAITAFREANHLHLEHYIHIHLADLSIMEGRLRDARRDLSKAVQFFHQSGHVFGNEAEIIAIIQLTLDYESGTYEHIPALASPLRKALLTGDSWVEIFEQLARVAVKSTFFVAGREAALAELDLFRTGYAERHGGVSEVLTILEASIDRLDWRFGDVEVALVTLDTQHLQSPIGQVLLKEIVTAHLVFEGVKLDIDTPRGRIADTLIAARQEVGNQRRRLVEKAFWLAVKEGHASPFLEHRDVFSGIGTRLSSGRFARGHVQLARLARRTVEIVRQSYWMPSSLRDLNITDRQFRIVNALQSGASNKEIARSLVISEATVKYHLAGLYKIFEVTRRGELIDKYSLIIDLVKN